LIFCHVLIASMNFQPPVNQVGVDIMYEEDWVRFLNSSFCTRIILQRFSNSAGIASITIISLGFRLSFLPWIIREQLWTIALDF